MTDRVGKIERVGEGDDLVAQINAIAASAERTLQERENLPCFGHAKDKDARDACVASKSRAGCTFRIFPEVCPWERMNVQARACQEASVMAGVPAREHALIIEHLWNRTKLQNTEPLAVMRAVYGGKECTVNLSQGKLVIPAKPAIIVLAGERGIGKTLAACHWLARTGGLYKTSYGLGNVNDNLRDWYDTRRLVIDQIGREQAASDYALSRLEAVIDARYANKRQTVLCANMDRASFLKRYDKIIEARLDGDGVFADLRGPDLRKVK